jgi:hypothetical protein
MESWRYKPAVGHVELDHRPNGRQFLGLLGDRSAKRGETRNRIDPIELERGKLVARRAN